MLDPEDLVQARTWFRKSADQNNVAAQTRLGRMLVKGEGGGSDWNAGRALWDQAAARGDTSAQENLRMLTSFVRDIQFRL